MTAPTQFRAFGSVVASELVHGVLADRLTATREVVRLIPLLRREVPLQRDEVAAIEFERQWLPPFWVQTVVHFRLLDGHYAPKVFIAIRTRRLRDALEELGWPIERVQFGSIGERPKRPLRELLGRDR